MNYITNITLFVLGLASLSLPSHGEKGVAADPPNASAPNHPNVLNSWTTGAGPMGEDGVVQEWNRAALSGSFSNIAQIDVPTDTGPPGALSQSWSGAESSSGGEDRAALSGTQLIVTWHDSACVISCVSSEAMTSPSCVFLGAKSTGLVASPFVVGSGSTLDWNLGFTVASPFAALSGTKAPGDAFFGV